MSSEDRKCLVCHRDSNETPLFTLDFQGSSFCICPQHVPILIHDPARLVGLLPGADKLSPSDIHD